MNKKTLIVILCCTFFVLLTKTSFTQNNFWIKCTGDLDEYTVSELAINSNDDIFAGTHGGGIFRSTDNGYTWAVINNGSLYSKVSSLMINSKYFVLQEEYQGTLKKSIQKRQQSKILNDSVFQNLAFYMQNLTKYLTIFSMQNQTTIKKLYPC